jgi:hypothetical protein
LKAAEKGKSEKKNCTFDRACIFYSTIFLLISFSPPSSFQKQF